MLDWLTDTALLIWFESNRIKRTNSTCQSIRLALAHEFYYYFDIHYFTIHRSRGPYKTSDPFDANAFEWRRGQKLLFALRLIYFNFGFDDMKYIMIVCFFTGQSYNLPWYFTYSADVLSSQSCFVATTLRFRGIFQFWTFKLHWCGSKFMVGCCACYCPFLLFATRTNPFYYRQHWICVHRSKL